MRGRRLSSLVLALGLLSASLAGLAEHHHGTSLERGTFDCTIDHERQDGPRAAGSQPEVRTGGERHTHSCVACQRTGQRSLTTSFLVAAGPGPSVDRSAVPVSEVYVSRPWTGRTLRGPPSA